MSGSRTALITLMLAGVFVGSIWLKGTGRIAGRRLFSVRPAGFFLIAVPTLLTGALVLGSASFDVGKSAVFDRLNRTTLLFASEDVSRQSRFDYYRDGLTQAVGSPVVGYGSAEGAELLHSGTADAEVIHILLTYGALGLLLYAAFWFSSFKLAYSLLRVRDQEIILLVSQPLGSSS